MLGPDCLVALPQLGVFIVKLLHFLVRRGLEIRFDPGAHEVIHLHLLPDLLKHLRLGRLGLGQLLLEGLLVRKILFHPFQLLLGKGCRVGHGRLTGLGQRHLPVDHLVENINLQGSQLGGRYFVPG